MGSHCVRPHDVLRKAVVCLKEPGVLVLHQPPDSASAMDAFETTWQKHASAPAKQPGTLAQAPRVTSLVLALISAACTPLWATKSVLGRRQGHQGWVNRAPLRWPPHRSSTGRAHSHGAKCWPRRRSWLTPVFFCACSPVVLVGPQPVLPVRVNPLP